MDGECFKKHSIGILRHIRSHSRAFIRNYNFFEKFKMAAIMAAILDDAMPAIAHNLHLIL